MTSNFNSEYGSGISHTDIVLARAAAAMKAAYPEYIAGVDDETYIADLIADLLLLAHVRELDLLEVLSRAQMHAENEIVGYIAVEPFTSKALSTLLRWRKKLLW
jgi:hypothetical protein